MYPSANVEWGVTGAKSAAGSNVAVATIEDETETEDLADSKETMLVDSGGYPINMSGDDMGVD